MRVISGSVKGRTLKAVSGSQTRPTTDKVKEAIFSMIGPYFTDGAVLDLFAGTGGLGIEALSRGMERAIFVDKEGSSIQTIRANLQATGLDARAEIYRNDALRALKALEKRKNRFDLVFLDPPYRLKIAEQLLELLLQYQLLQPNAIIVYEHDSA
ncbi:MAG: 16S rRNA (guanine(966)-N(2))-methyltransferase RsmD, partial [Paenibacillus sp. RIFOXYA1_FULL_44_5]